MNALLHFDDLKVGDRWQSRSRTVTETDVVAFAGLTGDYDPLHVDYEFAKRSPFGRPIAHGLLGLSFVAGLGSNYPLVETVAFVSVKEWTFNLPVFIGDTVSVVNEVTSLVENGRKRGRVIWRRSLLNQRGEVVQQDLFETLVAKSAPSNKSQSSRGTDVPTLAVGDSVQQPPATLPVEKHEAAPAKKKPKRMVAKRLPRRTVTSRHKAPKKSRSKK